MKKFKTKKSKRKILKKSKVTLDAIIENEIKTNFLRKKFSNEIIKHAESINYEITKSHKNLAHIDFVTIDGDDSKDFDDAVWATKKNDLFEIMVAISDVSYFIKENDALDIEAKKRGNSFYFPNKVIPMFPEKISNDICSLVPNKKKLCIVVNIILDKKGKIINSKVFRAFIVSKARLTYNEVENHINNNNSIKPKLALVIDNLYRVFKILKDSSTSRGKIDLELDKDKIFMSNKSDNFEFVKTKNNESNKIIEELMILANTTIAQKLLSKKTKTLFRNHEKPNKEKLSKLFDFLKNYGIKLKKTSFTKSKDFQYLLELRKNPNFKLIKENILKSQSKAYYHYNNKGHFGLSLKNYTHFTSPIRRYSDLMIHRNVVNNLIEVNTKNEVQINDSLCEHLLSQEKKSEKIERTILEKAACLYLTKIKIKKFFGYIDGLTEFGIFIKAKDFPFSGLILLKDIKNDYYDFDQKKLCVYGRNNGIIFKIGQKVSFKIKKNNVERGLIGLKNIEQIYD